MVSVSADLVSTVNSSVELRALCQTSSSNLSNEKEIALSIYEGKDHKGGKIL